MHSSSKVMKLCTVSHNTSHEPRTTRNSKQRLALFNGKLGRLPSTVAESANRRASSQLTSKVSELRGLRHTDSISATPHKHRSISSTLPVSPNGGIVHYY
ncbi:hypothetical protein EVAR_44793_1 [Eumeta japonica]|uniref:Uncharacterized protein n=1 Tax=Eumeta variegata TaxID=151549 RepID=A0A4C1X715_EUMVA|nr:hypothetical protein EVAR_44793_1 [Eumeta japonica]